MPEPPAMPGGSPLSEDEVRAFLSEPWIARLGTVGLDGWPVVTPVWFDFEDGGFVIIGRERAAWVEHIRRDSRVSLCIDDPDGDHRRVMVQGEAKIVEGPSARGPWVETARKMALRYMGGEAGLAYLERTLDFPRYTIRVEPLRVTTWRGSWARKYYA